MSLLVRQEFVNYRLQKEVNNLDDSVVALTVTVPDINLLQKKKPHLVEAFKRNNPGNIIKSRVTWKGEINCPGRFVCFRTVEDGLRAMIINLRNYQRIHGLNTIREIVNRWAPPNENQTNKLVTIISRRTNMGADVKLDLSNDNIISRIVQAIIYTEYGQNESLASIQRVVNENNS